MYLIIKTVSMQYSVILNILITLAYWTIKANSKIILAVFCAGWKVKCHVLFIFVVVYVEMFSLNSYQWKIIGSLTHKQFCNRLRL